MAYDQFIGDFISSIIQNVALVVVLIFLHKGMKISLATNLFFVNIILQNCYHFIISNGTLRLEGAIFFILTALFAFFLFGKKVGWPTFLFLLALTCVGIYNNHTEFSLFHFTDTLAAPELSGEEQYIIILPITMNIYLVSQFVSSQMKAKQRIYAQNDELKDKNKKIHDSITYAKRIQSAILPHPKFIKDNLPDSFIFYKPKDIVAGDFYWVEKEEDTVLFAAADCTGHGVPGAMVSVICNHGLNQSVNEYHLTDPGEILDKTKELVLKEFEKSEEDVKDGMDIALVTLTPGEGKHTLLRYAGAFNPLWIIREGASQVEVIKANKQPIGQFEKNDPFRTQELELTSGDSIYIFSDGFVDQFGGAQEKKYMSGNFKKFLLSIQQHSMQEQETLLHQEFESWKGDQEQIDDVCVMGVRL